MTGTETRFEPKAEARSPLVPRRKVLLVIMDGVGINPRKADNGVAQANTPHLDAYYARFGHTTLSASGHAVGLPDGQMGNSEVGHLTLGCGAIVRQDLVRINDSLESGELFTNPALVEAVRRAGEAGRALHLLGLVSDGGVHSHIDHLLALIELCKRHGVRPLLHMITDGRDTAPSSALQYVDALELALDQAGGRIATVMGRYYAMDRDKRWDRTERAWRALVLGKGTREENARAAITAAYGRGETDEFIKPLIIGEPRPLAGGDQLIMFNFRKDRPRQIVAALGLEQFTGFDRGTWPRVRVTCMMPYDRSFGLPFAFEPEHPVATLAQAVSEAGLKQFHCAETEKYAHVTYFFNGGRSEPFSGETHFMVPSPTVATYDLKPEMSAPQVGEAVVKALYSNKYEFMVVNFANGDMVGHTAVKDAVIHAVEVVDREVGRVLAAAEECGYSVVLTADHGNCEEMVDPLTGAPHTQHTTYPVPCLVIDEYHWQLSCDGGLANIAPTILQLMGLEVPKAMTSRSLLLKRLGKVAASDTLRGAA